MWLSEETVMPIYKTEFQAGKLSQDVENDVIAFLNERKEMAFTSQEIMAGVHFQINFSTLETSGLSTFAVADFISLLYEMVSKGKVTNKIVEGQMYFTAVSDALSKCPKCGREVAEPKKTWTLAGRPDRQGQRLTLKIGLFECPTHGTFRTTLNKQKT
jgi:hypothetical protein